MLIKKIKLLLWKLILNLESILNPYDKSDLEYFLTVKDDFTGEKYLIVDWIKSHNEQIDRLQDEMVWVKYQINKMNSTKTDI